MRKILPAIILFLIASSALAQDTAVAVKDTTWKRGGFGSLVFNQVAFDHWAGGGINSYSFTGLGFGFANYKKEKNFWNNYVNLQYGVIRTKYDRTVQKNTDVLELQTKAGHDMGHKFFLAALVNFKSQFANGYNLPNDSLIVSKFMSPAYLTVSVGVEWKPLDYFSIYLSPATGKFTFVLDQKIADQVVNGASLYGTDPAVYDTTNGELLTHGDNLRKELGAYLAAQFIKDVVQNVNVATRLTLFNNYTDKNESNRKNTDIAYDLLVTMKVNNWLSANFFLNIIYDNDITISDVDSDGNPTGTAGPRTQLKEGLGIGLTFKFGDELK
jgi:hypothetical protein